MSDLSLGFHVFILLVTESFSVHRFGLGIDRLDSSRSKINVYLEASFPPSQSLLKIPGLLAPKSSFIIYEQDATSAAGAGGTWGICWCLTLHRSNLGYKFSPSHNIAFHRHPISWPFFLHCFSSQISYPFDSKHGFLKRTKSVSLRDKDGEKDDNSQEL